MSHPPGPVMATRLARFVALLPLLALAACASSGSETAEAPTPASAPAETADVAVGSVESEAAAPAPAAPPAGGEPAPALRGMREASESSRRSSRADGAAMDREALTERDADVDRPRWDPDPEPGLLTAGDVDDHLNFDFFLGWLDRVRGRQQTETPDLSDRVTLVVTDRSGEPVSNAEVRIEAQGGRRARGLVTSTGTDGRLELFPTYDFGRGARELDLTVSLPGGRQSERARLRVGRTDRVEVQLGGDAPRRTRALDIAFAIDVTGSMGDELRYLTEEFRAIVERIEARYPDVDLRFGLVAYRDHGDRFVVREHDFTSRVHTMQGQLSDLQAHGGGDYPEAMDEALAAALGLRWRPEATRLLFLVADAPPHDGRIGATMEHVREARAAGIRMYPLAASGVGQTAEVVMRTAAALTQGRYLFLTDDSGIGLAHAEPKVPCYVVTQLNDLLVRVIASELEGRRVEPRRDEILREVGDYDAGVCESPPVVRINRQQDEPRAERLGGYYAP